MSLPIPDLNRRTAGELEQSVEATNRSVVAEPKAVIAVVVEVVKYL